MLLEQGQGSLEGTRTLTSLCTLLEVQRVFPIILALYPTSHKAPSSVSMEDKGHILPPGHHLGTHWLVSRNPWYSLPTFL